METCSLCGRRDDNPAYFEDHHLVPQGRGSKDTIRVCCDCGNQVHMLFSNNELRYRMNTLDALLSDERVQKWVRWVRKRREFGICAKAKKRR